MTLAEFMLARIAEDEEIARAAIGHSLHISTDWEGVATQRHIYRWSSARVLAECQAKRRIVSQYRLYDAYAQQHWRPEDEREQMNRYAMTVWDALRALAVPYADHPDFDKAWLPG